MSVLIWSDLELHREYDLQEQLPYEELDFSRSGEKFILIHVDGSAQKYMTFLFQKKSCLHFKSSDDVILHESVIAKDLIGLQPLGNCLMGIYIEPYQYYQNSIWL